MIDIIKNKYSNRAVKCGNIWMYFIERAKEVIHDCEKNHIKVTALEAFRLSGLGIQPSQTYSVDFPHDEDNWDKALEFLSNIRETDYLYEVWYDGYADDDEP